VADPELREITISCGALVDHLCLALAERGFASKVDVFPERAERDLGATVEVTGTRDTAAPLLDYPAAIERRHTNRAPFEAVALDVAVVRDVEQAAQLHAAWLRPIEAPRRESVADLVVEGDRTQ
jgi:hypothetical protein